MLEKAKEWIISLFLLIIGWAGKKICKIYYKGPNQALLPIIDPFLLESAQAIAEKIRNRELTSQKVVKACIRRIQEINHITKCIAFTRFDKAIEEARAVDALIEKGDRTPDELADDKPLLGVPFTVKDGISIDGVIRTAGIVSEINRVADKDAEVVALMRAAGAIPIATTNVPEMMFWWDTNNQIFGRTRNPYHSKYCAGGSSGGEAALIAAGGSFIGLGSDRGGSIRAPAYMCGIFGHKPTLGYVDLTGHFPVGNKADEKLATIGPLAKKAADLKPMLKVLTRNHPDLRMDEPVDIRKLKYYYMDNDGGGLLTNGADKVDVRIQTMMATVVDYFAEEYGIIVEAVNLPEMKYAPQMYVAAKKSPEIENVMDTWTCLKEILKGFVGLTNHSMELTWPSLIESLEPAYGSKKHEFLVKKAENLKTKFQELLQEDGIFLYPTQPTPPIHLQESLFRPHNRGYHAVFNVTQLPTTQCPITRTEEGLPIGLQIAASPKNDRFCLTVAEELEKVFGGWVPPPAEKI